jgi:uncharacterized protein DUF3987
MRRPADYESCDLTVSEQDLRSGSRQSREDGSIGYPKRAAWLEAQLASREWSVHDLQAQGGPDWKTTRKILDGLPVIQRFQLLVWPDTPADWRYVDRKPNAACEEIVSRVFRRLVELDSENPLRFHFDSDAQQLFVEWLADLESKVRGGDLHAALVSHLSKYRSLMPSLALLFELADRAATGFDGFVRANPGESPNFWVSLEHAKQAAAWCDYLESHARRIYSCVTTRRMRAARELADKIKQSKIGANGFFTCRDVYVRGWSGLDSPEAVKLAVEVLQDACWVREVVSEPSPLGGRPPNRYAVNPSVSR